MSASDTNQEMFDQFIVSRRSAGRAKQTITGYRYHMGAFLRWLTACHPDLTLADVQAEDIEAFLAEQHAERLSPMTVAGRYRTLAAFYRWRHTRRKLPGEPVTAAVEKPSVPKKAPRRVTLHQYSTLLDSIQPSDAPFRYSNPGYPGNWLVWRDRCLVRIMFLSGLRVGELIGLQNGDIDVENRWIRIRNGKGGKERFVPHDAGLATDLETYLQQRPPYRGQELWLASDGYDGVTGPLTREGVRQMLIRRCAQIGLPHLNPHAFRHGFAMCMLNEAGAELSAISKMMGHYSPAFTEKVYAQWQDEGLRRSYEAALGRLGAR